MTHTNYEGSTAEVAGTSTDEIRRRLQVSPFASGGFTFVPPAPPTSISITLEFLRGVDAALEEVSEYLNDDDIDSLRAQAIAAEIARLQGES